MKFKLAIVVGLLLLCVGSVRAQSPSNAELNDISDKMIASAVRDMPAHNHAAMAQSGCTGYTANQPQYSLFMPSDWAAQGGTFATISEQATNVSGALPSHNVSAMPGTIIKWTRSSNGASGTLYVYTNGNLDYSSNIGPNSTDQWTLYPSMVGNIYEFVFIGDGGTQDRNYLTVVAGSGPGLTDQDELSTNLIQQGQFSFAVPPMNQACQQCIDFPSSCLGANHTPYITATLKNVNTGETKSVSHAVAGNDFNEQENGYGSWTAGISVLPGDGPEPDPSDPPTGEIFCFAVGADIFNQKQSGDNYTWIVAKTKVKVLQEGTLGTNGPGITRWYVQTWCKDAQYEPIWQPEYIDTKGAATILMSVGQYELSMQDCYAEPGWPAWKCLPNAVTPPQPLQIGVGGTKYDCSTVLNTPLPK